MISFDGLGETYERIRRPAKFGRAREKIANYAQIKRQAGRVKPVIKVQSILPAIQDDPQAFYEVFSPITDMVSANPLIDYLQNDDPSTIVYQENFSCPQLYQRLVVGADGLAMMCDNDVLIGLHSIIMDGVTIGHGAIIGAGSVVTKDIPPYAVAAGVPARVIRKRFTDEDIAFLLNLCWWNRDDDWIRQHATAFSDLHLLKQIIDGEPAS